MADFGRSGGSRRLHLAGLQIEPFLLVLFRRTIAAPVEQEDRCIEPTNNVVTAASFPFLLRVCFVFRPCHAKRGSTFAVRGRLEFL
jgi:hypothetical protein